MNNPAWLALIAAVASIAVAGISGLAAVRAATASRKADVAATKADQVHTAVGRPNGNGTLVEMNEKLLGAAFELLAWKDEHTHTDEENDTASRARDEAASARLTLIEQHLGIDNLEGTP